MNRKEFIKTAVRGGLLAGIVGFGAILSSRKEKFSCSDQCGKCTKFNHGKCSLGIK